MLLIVGLGNPGKKHAGNRHNVGFMAADAIHRQHGFSPWRRRFTSEASEGVLSGEKCLLIKPQTYMNLSGNAVSEALRFYKLQAEDVVVIHDEVDLPPGKIRMKAGGGVAGHNGLRSVGATIGDAFRRLRIGVGHPGHKEAVPHYVLHDFSKADGAWLDPLLDAVAEHAPLLAEGKDATFSNRLHEATGGDGKGRKAKPAERMDTASKSNATDRPSAEDADGPLARGLKRLFGRKAG